MTYPAWPFYPLALLRDAAYLLALAHQQQLQVNAQGQLQVGSVARLTSGLILERETRSPRSPGLCFLIGLLGHAGFLAEASGCLRLSDAGHAWLGQPAHRQIDQLRQVWWFAPEVNACWLPPTRRQRPLDSHWQALVRALAGWLAGLPADRWTPAADLYVHPDLAALFRLPREGHRLPGVRQAFAGQNRAMVDFLLAVALPRLGLIEVDHGTDWQVRPTAEGVDWLRRAVEHARLLQSPTPQVVDDAPVGVSMELRIPSPGLRFPLVKAPAVVIDPRVAVEPEAEVRLAVHLHAPALSTFEIAHLAELHAPGAPPPAQEPAHYRITAGTLQQAVAWGYPVADALFLLDRFADDPLPPAVVHQIHRWRDEMTVLHCEAGYRLTASSPAIMAALHQREPFRRRTAPLHGGALQDTWVSRVEALELFRYLRRVGYDIDLPPDPNDWPLQPRLRQPLPLSQLLVVLRTYQQLRRLVPGLAILELEDLERALVSSLLPEDLAGVERLVASHVTFLKHHVKRVEVPEPGAAEPPGEPGAELAPPRSGAPVDPALEGRLALLRGAAQAGTTLDITYADTHGKVSQRRVRPLRIEERWGRRYLLAFCELRQGERHFRLDRIVDVQ